VLQNTCEQVTTGLTSWLRKWGKLLYPIIEWSKAKQKQTQHYFRHSFKNCSVISLCHLQLIILQLGADPCFSNIVCWLWFACHDFLIITEQWRKLEDLLVNTFSGSSAFCEATTWALAERHHQWGISALLAHTLFCEGKSDDLAKRLLFSLATFMHRFPFCDHVQIMVGK